MVTAWIVLMSLLYPLAMFRGLEPYSGYWGNVYQALHPGSFAADPFMSPDRPTMQSLVYAMMRWGGDWWLDDRVTFLIFVGLTAVALVGIDKTARLLGASKPTERLALLSLMLLGHQLLNNHAFAVDPIDFNPTVMAAPLIIWLLYGSLSGAAWWRLAPPAALLMLISIKSAAMPLLIAGAIIWKDQLGARGKRLAAAAAALAVVAGLAAYYGLVRPGESNPAWVFDHVVGEDPSEVNPFRNPWPASLVFLALCAAGLRLQGTPVAVWARVRLVATLGLLVWLLGGLYITYAPAGTKIPYLAALQPTRMLWWTQYVLYVAMGLWLLQRIQRARTAAAVAAAWTALMGLYLLHSTPQLKLAAAVFGMTAVVVWAVARTPLNGGPGGWNPARWSPAHRLGVTSLAMAAGVFSLYVVGTLRHRMEALRCWVRHGVMGDNVTAKWIGVNDYIRRATPPEATFLALSTTADGRLTHDESLRVRTGRSMVYGHVAGMYFDAERMRWFDAQSRWVNEVLAAWERRAPEELLRALVEVGLPDYIVAPSDQVAWLRDKSAVPYHVETVQGGFAVLRKRAEALATARPTGVVP